MALTGAFTAPVAGAATGHQLVAHYAGHGSGRVAGSEASGSATLTGRGNLMGAGTLTGSAQGRFVSRTCVTFSGSAVLKGRRGSLSLRASRGSACASSTSGATVSFSGEATVVGGSGAFLHAHGRVAFSGTYARDSGAVTVSLSGKVTY
jgi:hypothetical protein